MSAETVKNEIEEYWQWLDSLPELSREAVLLEDPDARGRPDPAFDGQAIIHIMRNVNTFSEFKAAAEPIVHDSRDLVMYWNIWMAGMKLMAKHLTGKEF